MPRAVFAAAYCAVAALLGLTPRAQAEDGWHSEVVTLTAANFEATITAADVLLLLRELLALHLLPVLSVTPALPRLPVLTAGQVLSNEQGVVLLLLSDARPSDLEPQVRSCGCCTSHRCAQHIPGGSNHMYQHTHFLGCRTSAPFECSR